ncbi:MAG: hypothetical protein PHP42_01170 [Bacteroidota bacterium]|nr:hypothetical protein [Bacteroidota bacterium]
MFWKVSLKQDVGTAMKNVGSFIVFGSFAVGAFYFSNFVTAYLLDNVKIGLFLFHRFVGMFLFIFFVTINLGNMVVSFSTLYRSPEVDFLLSNPVSYRNIFVIKFLDNFFYSSGTLFLVGFSVLLGYGVHFSLPWHFYPLAMAGVMIPFMFLAACMAVIVLLLVMKLASKINFKVLIGAIVIFYVFQVYLYFRVSNPIHMVEEVMKYYPHVDLYFGSLDPGSVKLLPNFWVSEFLYFYVTKNFVAVGGYVFLLVLSTAALFVFTLVLGNALFYSTWITSLSLKSMSVKKLTMKSSFFSFRKKSFFVPQTEVLLKKEFWQFVREPSQWIHFVVMFALLAVFLSSVSTLNIKLQSPELKAVVYLVVFIFNIFLINSIALRFGFPLISLEGNAYWTLKSTPISAHKFYWTKFFVATIFLVCLSIVISWLSNIPYLYARSVEGIFPGMKSVETPHVAVRTLAYFSILVTPVITLTLTSMNYGLGSVYANFAEKNPIRIASSQGATMTFLLTLVYLVLLLAVYLYPATAMFVNEARGTAIDWRVLQITFLIITIPSLIIIGCVHLLGLRSLRRDF